MNFKVKIKHQAQFPDPNLFIYDDGTFDRTFYDYCIEFKNFWNDVIKLKINDYYDYDDRKFIMSIKWPRLDDLFKNDVYMCVKVNTKPDIGSNIKGLMVDFVKQFCNKLFIAFNLSMPGSIDFYGSAIEPNKMFKEDLNYCSFGWFDSFESLKKYNWLPYKIIPLETTWNWIMSLNIGIKQFASNPVERSLFSLLNYSNGNVTPINILWLSIALESIYQTPSDLISSTLKRRIFLVLGEPKTNSKKIKKAIDDFYKLRSKIIHGNFQVGIPNANECFDSAMYDEYSNIIDYEPIIIGILIGTIQNLILNSSTSFEFTENLTYLKTV